MDELVAFLLFYLQWYTKLIPHSSCWYIEHGLWCHIYRVGKFFWWLKFFDINLLLILRYRERSRYSTCYLLEGLKITHHTNASNHSSHKCIMSTLISLVGLHHAAKVEYQVWSAAPSSTPPVGVMDLSPRTEPKTLVVC